MSFFVELRRRKVFKVAVAYAIVGWLLIEVASTVFPVLQIPDWAVAFVTMLVLLGFPVSLILSWAFDITPGGIERTSSATGSAESRIAGRKFDLVIIGCLVLALGFVVADNYLLDDESSVLPNSVAVLPLKNLSLDPDNAFFATGIHDTILNELAKIADMNVIARTSMQRYAESDLSFAEIAAELNVETIMEGSVQYAEGRVLVTVQLIDPQTESHLWSGNYDREFADIFVIQADIAQRIAAALEAQLLPSELASIEKRPTDSADAWTLYLRAANLWQSANPGEGGVENSIIQALLDRAIGLDPNFALAYALKARPYSGVSAYFCEAQDEEERARLARLNVDRALTLDPDLGQVQAAFGTIEANAGRIAQATQAFERALQLNSNDPEILISAADFYSTVEEHDEAIKLAHRAVELDPSSAGLTNSLGDIYARAGELETSIEWTRRAMLLDPSYAFAPFDLSRTYAALGSYAEAVEATRVAEELFRPDCHVDPGILALMGHTYARAGYQEDAERLIERARSTGDISPSAATVAHLALGETELALRAFRTVEGPARPNAPGIQGLIRNFLNDPVLESGDFVRERIRLGFQE